MMKKHENFSPLHGLYLKKIKREKAIVVSLRIAILVLFLGIWELFATTNVYDPFITSSPSRIAKTIKKLFIENNLIYHICITLSETILGFLIAGFAGYLIALALWWSERLQKVLEPYIVVLNSLPKIALGPIIIVWCGSGMKAIVFMATLIGIIVAVLHQLLVRSGREEQALLTTIAGLIVVLFIVTQQIGSLFDSVKNIFNL